MRKQSTVKAVCAILAFLNWLVYVWYLILHAGMFSDGQATGLLFWLAVFTLVAYGTYQSAIKEV